MLLLSWIITTASAGPGALTLVLLVQIQCRKRLLSGLFAEASPTKIFAEAPHGGELVEPGHSVRGAFYFQKVGI